MSAKHLAEMAMEQGKGILRLAPAWVPRVFCVPARRIKLHPDDYFALGGDRGGIDERWFASTTPADNGPKTSPNEGLSFAVFEDGGKSEQFLLRDAVDELKGAIVGDRIWDSSGGWPMFSKFFDNQAALPHHVHHRDEHASLTGQLGKPESYYFPPQVNNHPGDFPHTYFGLEPGTTRDQVRECLAAFAKGDNQITSLARAYRLDPGTGWDVPPGILHAPGSLCTYEPQRASDVFAMYQSLAGRTIISEDLLWKNCPDDRRGDLDFLLDVLDWDLNTDPDFLKNRKMFPVPVQPEEETRAEGYIDKWICYKTTHYSAKELTILPGKSVTIKDAAAYGLIVLQGHGKMGVWDIETPSLIRFGQLTNDEFFVSEDAAKEGVTITNPSTCDPIVMLKHFGHDNPDLDVAKYT
jgi:hypothetical protein